MWKKVLIKTLTILIQIIIVLVLVAILAKTGNMPTMIPEKYIEKIVEYTDKTLIAVKLIKDEKIIKKYSEKAAIVKTVGVKKATVSKEKYEFNILRRIYNIFLLNDYEWNRFKELKHTSGTLNLYINNQLKKLNNIIDSSYVKNIIKEKQLGISSAESYDLVNNIIYGFKYIEGFSIFNKGDKLITSVYKGRKPPYKESDTLSQLQSASFPFDLVELNNNSYFIYLIKGFEEDLNVVFLLKPEYFNISFDSIDINHKFFIFDRNYNILNSNINDYKLLSQLESAIRYKSFEYNEKTYNIEYMPLENINLYAGIIFKKYPLLYMVLNILKWVLFIVAIYFLYIGIKLLSKKLSDMKLKQKPSEIEMVTGAMMEVAKSIQSTSSAAAAGVVSIDQSDIEEAVDNVFNRYASSRNRSANPIKEAFNIKQETTGWKKIK